MCLYMASIIPLSIFCVILLLGRLLSMKSAPPMTRLFYLIPCWVPNGVVLLCYRSQQTVHTDHPRTKEMPTTKRLYARPLSSINIERPVISTFFAWINFPDRLATSKGITQVFKHHINTNRSIVVDYFSSTFPPFPRCQAPNFSL